MKYFLSTVLLVLSVLLAHAGGDRFSYLYLQGDKQTPFYVKLEDAMQPRFGKNYCIIPRMAPGPAHIEILFQQNLFPSQKFTVLIPEAGSRAFLLVKKADSFMLYDLQQGFYLPSGNAAEDDKMPEAAVATMQASQPVPNAEPQKYPVAEKPENPQPVAEVPHEKQDSVTMDLPVPPAGKPVFIPGMELGKNQDKGAEPAIDKRNDTASGNPSGIVNTDCPAPLAASEFEKIFGDLSAYKADEERLEYLSGKMGNCYASWQARTLTGKLEGDAARYEFLRKIYPRITDQSAFPLLDDLLSTEVWKAEFARLVHH